MCTRFNLKNIKEGFTFTLQTREFSKIQPPPSPNIHDKPTALCINNKLQTSREREVDIAILTGLETCTSVGCAQAGVEVVGYG